MEPISTVSTPLLDMHGAEVAEYRVLFTCYAHVVVDYHGAQSFVIPCDSPRARAFGEDLVNMIPCIRMGRIPMRLCCKEGEARCKDACNFCATDAATMLVFFSDPAKRVRKRFTAEAVADLLDSSGHEALIDMMREELGLMAEFLRISMDHEIFLDLLGGGALHGFFGNDVGFLPMFVESEVLFESDCRSWSERLQMCCDFFAHAGKWIRRVQKLAGDSKEPEWDLLHSLAQAAVGYGTLGAEAMEVVQDEPEHDMRLIVQGMAAFLRVVLGPHAVDILHFVRVHA
jgi:hypothetical protein